MLGVSDGVELGFFQGAVVGDLVGASLGFPANHTFETLSQGVTLLGDLGFSLGIALGR